MEGCDERVDGIFFYNYLVKRNCVHKRPKTRPLDINYRSFVSSRSLFERVRPATETTTPI